MKYHGWTNRETWVTHLWLTSDENLYSEVMELPGPQVLEEYVWNLLGERVTDGFAQDLLSCALDGVNWEEIYAALHE